MIDVHGRAPRLRLSKFDQRLVRRSTGSAYELTERWATNARLSHELSHESLGAPKRPEIRGVAKYRYPGARGVQ
jgi:hypothetical protein